MRITSKGQVTIPIEVRLAAGLLPDCEVEFEVKGTTVLLRKARNRTSRGRGVVERLQGRGSVQMTTDQILSLTRGD